MREIPIFCDKCGADDAALHKMHGVKMHLRCRACGAFFYIAHNGGEFCVVRRACLVFRERGDIERRAPAPVVRAAPTPAKPLSEMLRRAAPRQ